MKEIKSLLSNANVLYAFIAQLFCDCAAWLDNIVILMLIVYKWDSPAYFLILISFASASGVLLGSIYITKYIDNVCEKHIMIFSSAGRIVVSLLFIFANNITTLLLLVFIKFFFTSFYDPTVQKLIALEVNENAYATANSISKAISATLKIISPFLGITLLLFSSYSTVFITCALCYLLGLIILFFLKATPPILEIQKINRSFKSNLSSVLKYLLSKKILLYLTITMSLFNFSVFISEFFYIKSFQLIHLSRSTDSYMFMSVGIGSLVGALLAPKLLNKLTYLKSFCLGILGDGLCLLGIFLVFKNANQTINTYIPLILLLLMSGFFYMLTNISFITIIQKVTDRIMIGRIATLNSAASMAALFLGLLTGLLIINNTELLFTYLASAILIFLTSIFSHFLFFQQQIDPIS